MPLENDLIASGRWPVCGVDEAGRGPLAGPVVAAAVIMGPVCPLRTVVRDSKRLTASRREDIYNKLVACQDVQIGVSVVDAPAIDTMNILRATLAAMREAVGKDVALLGNIPPRDVLAQGAPGQVRQSVHEILESVEDTRGLILSCGGGMPPGVSAGNIDAFLAAAAQ